ncbi:LysM peptidoglycan-binding domain-containing protein [Cryobacterium sp. TMT1-21]|uniref:LysM peptidoglycan-binding domain-containing protein n=1 Tax=Cryobacterium shii TaxID=1259235 RepID=A0AAQ2C4X3_9MICO|nr:MULTISPECIES: LysM peptidoglycan-binding domain-containing protein [Cryobacterium]TFC43848.1 LysM peptidoglycan-binding domain-containing protein [Cryobacterium shii]TFC80657.1 LysM peptidoglycan-binding domain-containing protein [Cryobacterium sp. TmT2-59]TFD14041.1 LysM peptidoglycan-binding domain-containing protein [Cryobacterium sp. TMT1-21]TFD20306.1 LysM peptidoglycan-binding domain-containing protein [Cryobacterium sp. TMT4-10]TFD23204.1 LysM peptidoglycan-binding domain-containing 
MSTAFTMSSALGLSGALDLSTAPDASAAQGLRVATGRSTLRITRRGRIVLTMLVSVPLVATALAVALNGGIAVAENSNVGGRVATAFEYVTVQSGQSLWELAETVAPTSDPREVIAEIVSLNQLPSDSVQPGQRLALPNEY